MENYLEFLKKAISHKSSNFPEERYLSLYFSEIQKREIKYIFDFRNKFYFHDFLEENYPEPDYFLGNIEDISTYKIIHSVVNEKDANNRYFLLPLVSFIDCDDIILNHLIEIDYFSIIINRIKKEIMSYTVNISYKKILPDYDSEKILTAQYYEGLKESNLRKMYRFIDAIEDSMECHPDTFIFFILKIILNIAENDFYAFFENKDPISILYLLMMFSNSDKLKIADKSNNIYAKYVILIGQSRIQPNENLYSEEAKSHIKNIFNVLMDDTTVNIQFLEHLMKNVFVLKRLSFAIKEYLEKTDKSSLHLFIDRIYFDQYHYSELEKLYSEIILKLENKINKEEICKELFLKWEDYVNNYHNSLFSIFIINISCIAIYHIRVFSDKEIILNSIKCMLEEIDEYKNEWHRSVSEMNSRFYKLLTKLFHYCFIFKDIEENENIKSKIYDIINTNMILKYEDPYQKKSTKSLFNEYIFEKK